MRSLFKKQLSLVKNYWIQTGQSGAIEQEGLSPPHSLKSTSIDFSFWRPHPADDMPVLSFRVLNEGPSANDLSFNEILKMKNKTAYEKIRIIGWDNTMSKLAGLVCFF